MQQLDLPAIGARIRTIREDNGLRQQDLADAIKGHLNTISKVERGLSKPPQELLDYISKTFKYNIDWILTGQGNQPSPSKSLTQKKSIRLKVYEMELELKEIRKLMKEILKKLDDD
jgi:transcriptional regulator with XRE-family HTH domain